MSETAERRAPEEEGREASLAPQGWKNPPTVRDLKQDMTDAKASHDAQKGKISGWLDSLFITGSAKPKTKPGHSSVQPKLIRKQAEWRYPALTEPFLNSPDLFAIDPVTWEDSKAAYQNGLLLNNQINTKLDKVAFIDEYVRAAVNEGTAIIRTGWDFREEEVEEEQPVVEFFPNPGMAQLHQELAQMKAENPTAYLHEVPEELQQAHDMSVQTGMPMEPRVTGTKLVKVRKTVKNAPTMEVCDYRNVVLDPSCGGDIDKAGFIIYSFESSLSELKKDGKYQNLDHTNIEANSVLGDPDHTTENTTDFNFTDKARKKFIVHEYWGFWDIAGTGVAEPIVAAWVGDVLIRLEENPFPDKALPFVFVPLRPVRKSAYGEPDGELLEDNQKILGAVMRGMLDILGRSANGQVGYRKDALDPTNRRKFLKGDDYEYNQNVDPRMAFYMHTYPEIPQSAQFILQQQTMEAESMSGVKAFSQGINSGSLGDVAAGIRGALDAASKRETSILRRLASGMVKVGRKIIAMNMEFLDEAEVVRVTNEQFVTVRRDDLAGNLDLRLTVSTAEEDNAKAEELAFMLQTMGNNMDPKMARLILRDIARLRKMPELAKEIEEYEPEPDPIAEQLRQLELLEKQAQIAKIHADAGNSETGAILNQAKAITEQAKARSLGSKADRDDLDFVEQESGVKQERDKELQSEQARGNMNLELLKHDLEKEDEAQKELSKYLAKSSEK